MSFSVYVNVHVFVCMTLTYLEASNSGVTVFEYRQQQKEVQHCTGSWHHADSPLNCAFSNSDNHMKAFYYDDGRCISVLFGNCGTPLDNGYPWVKLKSGGHGGHKKPHKHPSLKGGKSVKVERLSGRQCKGGISKKSQKLYLIRVLPQYFEIFLDLSPSCYRVAFPKMKIKTVDVKMDFYNFNSVGKIMYLKEGRDRHLYVLPFKMLIYEEDDHPTSQYRAEKPRWITSFRKEWFHSFVRDSQHSDAIGLLGDTQIVFRYQQRFLRNKQLSGKTGTLVNGRRSRYAYFTRKYKGKWYLHRASCCENFEESIELTTKVEDMSVSSDDEDIYLCTPRLQVMNFEGHKKDIPKIFCSGITVRGEMFAVITHTKVRIYSTSDYRLQNEWNMPEATKGEKWLLQ